jgi:Na+/melibiose symporter-like transporter
VLLATLRIVPESHADIGHRRFDTAGAVTGTGGLALLVYAISKAPDVGWGATRTIVLLIVSAVILLAFLLIELRGRAPLMPVTIFRNRSLSGANVVAFLMGMVIFANFFLLTLYVQQVLGWSALFTGVTFLATAGTTVIWAGVAQALTTKVGPRPIIVAGLLILAAALYWYTRIPVDGNYWPDLLPAYLVFAVGLAFAFVPVSIAALSGVAPREAGLASGLLNTSQQIGGAIGVALVTTIFTSETSGKQPHSKTEALGFLTTGFQHGFWALFALALAGAAAGLILLRGIEARDVTEHEAAGVAI